VVHFYNNTIGTNDIKISILHLDMDLELTKLEGDGGRWKLTGQRATSRVDEAVLF
jgi:hypothetical protein